MSQLLNMNGLTGVDISMVTLTNIRRRRADPTEELQLDQYHVSVTLVPYIDRWSTPQHRQPRSAAADWYSERYSVTVAPAIPTN